VTILPDSPVTSLDEYVAHGGGRALERARALGPDAIIDLIAASGLRGRGGAGFPTARKWRSVCDAGGTRRYVVVNAAEGEPGTFKDRLLIRRNPYQLLEGMAIGAIAVGALDAYIGLKAKFRPETERVTGALREMAGAGWLEGLDVSVVQGPDDYLYGEETGLLEVIEGNDALPRNVPPYLHGLFATRPQLGWNATPAEPGEGVAGDNPTLVNNVETFSHVPAIIADGPEAFRSAGTARSPGTTLFTACGDVTRAGVWELPLGTSLRALLEDCAGGVRDGRALKMICSGVSNPVLRAELVDTATDYESLADAGGGLGSAGFIFYDDTVCALAVARMFSTFLNVSSCGQCPPCKIQSGVITEALAAVEVRGDGNQLPRIERALLTVADGNRCYLAVEEQVVVASILRRFPEDVVAHEEGRCTLRHDLALPLLDELTGDRFVYAV